MAVSLVPKPNNCTMSNYLVNGHPPGETETMAPSRIAVLQKEMEEVMFNEKYSDVGE